MLSQGCSLARPIAVHLAHALVKELRKNVFRTNAAKEDVNSFRNYFETRQESETVIRVHAFY